MKKTIFFAIFLSVTSTFFGQNITKEFVTGTWKVTGMLPFDSRGNQDIKELIDGFKNSTFLFSENGNFQISTTKSSKVFKMITGMTAKSKWKVDSEKNLIKIGTTKDSYTKMGIQVGSKEGKIVFYLDETAMYLFVEKQLNKQLIPKETDTSATKNLLTKIRGIDKNLFEAKRYTKNTTINYRFLQPKTIVTNKKYPLVIVFHGSGAIGTDNEKQLWTMAKLWAEPTIQSKYPAFVLAPQFPTRSSNYTLDASRNVLTSKSEPCLETVFQLIDSLKTTLPIDLKRIYIVGYSMGASTTINALSLRPDLFAAAVSFAGIPQFDKMDVLKNKPIWIIHGNKDTDNTIESDLLFFEELKYNSKILFWELDGIGHEDIIGASFLGEAIPKWLFSFKLN
ncbi:dienelactone hydrolase family protein [Flavobacterium ponti]|uniref:Dienelactone hydrolase family protein n=1 Tax=Flavobacterium ponti TaxID=665133 RepID=A0ABV9P6H5_9FLAO